MKLSLILSIISCISVATSSAVLRVNDKNFHEIVESSSKWSLVDYYADWCRHCKQLEPIYEQLGELFKDESKVQILRINGDEDGRKTVKKYKIDGFPMIQMYHGTDEPLVFEGGRDLLSLSNFVQSITNIRLPSPEDEGKPAKVLQFNDLDFSAKVLNNEEGKISVVAFTASWCGHCKNLQPTWEKLANRIYSTDLESHLQIGEVKTSDVPSEKLMEQFGISGFPAIFVFDPSGESSADGVKRPAKYAGDRSLESLIEFINEHAGLHRTEDGQLNKSAGRVSRLDSLLKEKLRRQQTPQQDDEAEGVALGPAISLLRDIDQIHRISISSIKEKDEYIKKGDDLSMLPYYKKLVNKIINGEEEFFKKEYNRLTKIVTTNSRNLQEKTVDSMQRRINVLNSFIDNL